MDIHADKWEAATDAEKKHILLHFVKTSVVPKMRVLDKHPQKQLAVNLKNKIDHGQITSFVRPAGEAENMLRMSLTISMDFVIHKRKCMLN